MQVLGTTGARMLLSVTFMMFLLGAGTASAHTVTATSQISIRYGQGTFQGRVASSAGVCEGARTVNLYKAREGADAVVGSTTTDDGGNWSISLSVDEGMFYAVAPATTDSSYTHFHECRRADSDTVVIENGGQVAVLAADQTPFRDAASGGTGVLGAGQGPGGGGPGVGAGRERFGNGDGDGGAGGIPLTGGDILPFVVAGTALIVAGIVLLLRRRRRRTFVVSNAPPPPPPPPRDSYVGTNLVPPADGAPRHGYDSGAESPSGPPVAATRADHLGRYVEPVTNQEEPADLREYLAVIAGRKWTVLLITLIVAGGAVAYSLRQTPLYRTGARVLVGSVPPGQTAPQTTATESQLVASEQVAARVGDDLDVAPGAALGGLHVEAVADSQVLAVSYTSPDPAFAARAANSFAINYIELREEQALEALVADRRTTERRIRNVQTALRGVLDETARARAAGDDARLEALETDQLSLSARLGVLRQQLDDLNSDATLGRGMGDVIARADVPGAPFSPDVMTNGLLGLLFGLGLGIAAAFVRRQLDSRFQERTDVERILGAPVLATIMKFKVDRGEPWPVVTLARPRDGASEAYRGLRTNLQVLMDQKGYRSLLVTSPSAGEGKTITSANLAVAFAQAGRRVALVSADLRRPRVELYFRIRSDFAGLSTWLSGTDETPVLTPTNLPNLDILPSGPTPPNPSELLTSPRLRRLVDELEKSYHLVIFDSAPLLPVADAVGLAYQLDATLMVVDAAATHRSSTEHAREKLERVGGRLVGAVLNAYDPSLPYYFHELEYYYAAEAFVAETPAPANGGGRHAAKTPGRKLFSRR